MEVLINEDLQTKIATITKGNTLLQELEKAKKDLKTLREHLSCLHKKSDEIPDSEEWGLTIAGRFIYFKFKSLRTALYEQEHDLNVIVEDLEHQLLQL